MAENNENLVNDLGVPNRFFEPTKKKSFYWFIPILLFFLSAISSYIYIIFQSPPIDSFNFQLIDGNATIIFDKDHGIPYINGTSENSVYFSLGFLHAFDRPYDLELNRAIAYGRTAEIKGPEGISHDKFIRSLQYEKIVDQEILNISPEYKNRLISYANGINEYMEIKGGNFEKWTIKDTLMILKYYAFRMSEHWKLIYDRTAIAEKTKSVSLAEKLIPNYLYHPINRQISVINNEDISQNSLYNETEYTSQKNPSHFHKEMPINAKIPESASNSWAVHKKISQTGKPFLAVDVHGSHKIPSEMYIISSKFSEKNISLFGATIAGLPFILDGRNDEISWGITSSMSENIELYEINMNTTTNKYLYQENLRDLQVNHTIIKVKDHTDIDFALYSTHHGPIISYPLTQSTISMNTNIALLWAGIDPTIIDTTLEGLFDLNFAKNAKEIDKAISKIKGLAAGFTFATKQNDIGFWLSGLHPIRNTINDSLYIRDGSYHKNDPIGYYQIYENPHVLNPAQQYTVACNNRINPKSQAFHGLGTTIPATERSLRAKDRIDFYRKLNIQNMKEMQNDVVDLFGYKISGKLIQIVENYSEKYYPTKENDKRVKIEKVVKNGKNWNGEMKGGYKYSLFYSVWYEELIKLLLNKQFPIKHEREAIFQTLYADYFVANLIYDWSEGKNLSSEFCETDENKNQTNWCVYNVFESLFNVYERLTEELGENEQNWYWGNYKQLEIPHEKYNGNWIYNYIFGNKFIGYVFLI